MSILLNNSRKLNKHPKKHKTKVLNDKLNELHVKSLDFTVDYGENDVIITTENRDNKYYLYIKKKDNVTKCVELSFDKTNILWLDKLLLNVADDDKCREIDNGRPGIYYIELIFNLLKALRLNIKDFNPTYFQLCDAASIKSNDLSVNANVDKQNTLYLSNIKLLLEGRTFYEGYGFLPVYNTDFVNFNYGAFDEYIGQRQKLLTLPIHELLDIIKKLNLTSSKKISKKIQIPDSKILGDIQTIYDIISDKYKDTFAFASLSVIFSYFMNSNKEDIVLKDVCYKIHEFIDHLNRLMVLMGIANAPPYLKECFLTYIITDDITHYDKIASIYAKYNIKRYEDYASYLSITVDDNKFSGGGNAKLSLRTIINKQLHFKKNKLITKDRKSIKKHRKLIVIHKTKRLLQSKLKAQG